TALQAGQTLTVVYSGRLAPASSNVGPAPVTNGQWVQTGDVIWFQYTSQNIGTRAIHASTRILQPNGTISVTTLDPSCALNAVGGSGFGFTVSTPGWLQTATTYLVDGGFPQGSVYINIYILNSMPTGGTGTTCTNTLASAQIGALLVGQPSGSSYPVSFI